MEVEVELIIPHGMPAMRDCLIIYSELTSIFVAFFYGSDEHVADQIKLLGLTARLVIRPAKLYGFSRDVFVVEGTNKNSFCDLPLYLSSLVIWMSSEPTKLSSAFGWTTFNPLLYAMRLLTWIGT